MSPWHLLILLLIVLLVIGSKRLPSLGRDLGRAFHGFKDGVTGKADQDEIASGAPREEAVDEAVRARQTTPAATPEVAAADVADAKADARR